MTLLLPALIFVVVFAGVLAVNRRSQRTVVHLSRHQIVGASAIAGALPQPRTSILDIGQKAGAAGRLASRLTGSGVRAKAEKLLLEAGSPMPVATYLLLRVVFMFALAPLFVLFVFNQYGFSL